MTRTAEGMAGEPVHAHAADRLREAAGRWPPARPEALAVMGPTATGKTGLAVGLARALDGEIVSVDSRQAYRGMEVGTGAPTPEERDAVPHHGVAFLEPDERYSAGEFARRARGWIAGIRGRSRFPVLEGGTGFFLRALTDPVFDEPEMDPDRRERLETWLEERPPEELRRWTRRLDPDLEEELDALDPQRCARTLELTLLAGRPLTWWHEHGEPEAEPLDAMVAVLELPEGVHRDRIRERTRALLERGWADEVRALRATGHGEGDPPFTALGYREVAAWVDGEAGREETVEAIVRETWRYARRQRTWFRHQVPDDALRLDARRPVDDLAAAVIEELGERIGRDAGTG